MAKDVITSIVIDKVIYFQDYFTTFTTPATIRNSNNCTAIINSKKRCNNGNGNGNGDSVDTDIDPAEAFFELANASKVGFRLTPFLTSTPTSTSTNTHIITNKNVEHRNKSVVVTQDNGCEIHTGGIVWETAYLLALYLIYTSSSLSSQTTNHDGERYPHRDSNSSYFPLGKVLEVGAGCGMLGLILASLDTLCTKVIMTETTDVMPNLIANVNANIVKNSKTDHHDPLGKINTGTTNAPCCPAHRISAHQLCWINPHRDIRLCQKTSQSIGDIDSDNENSHDLTPHSFDTIVGTDVIFSTKLVVPLLTTLRKMSHDTTKIYLCLQVRCAEAHKLLMEQVEKFGFMIRERTNVLKEMEGCEWGLELECKIFQLTRILVNEGKRTMGDERKLEGNGGTGKRKKEDSPTRRTIRKQKL